jgi:hypothetical protein
VSLFTVSPEGTAVSIRFGRYGNERSQVEPVQVSRFILSPDGAIRGCPARVESIKARPLR